MHQAATVRPQSTSCTSQTINPDTILRNVRHLQHVLAASFPPGAATQSTVALRGHGTSLREECKVKEAVPTGGRPEYRPDDSAVIKVHKKSALVRNPIPCTTTTDVQTSLDKAIDSSKPQKSSQDKNLTRQPFSSPLSGQAIIKRSLRPPILSRAEDLEPEFLDAWWEWIPDVQYYVTDAEAWNYLFVHNVPYLVTTGLLVANSNGLMWPATGKYLLQILPSHFTPQPHMTGRILTIDNSFIRAAQKARWEREKVELKIDRPATPIVERADSLLTSLPLVSGKKVRFLSKRLSVDVRSGELEEEDVTDNESSTSWRRNDEKSVRWKSSPRSE